MELPWLNVYFDLTTELMTAINENHPPNLSQLVFTFIVGLDVLTYRAIENHRTYGNFFRNIGRHIMDIFTHLRRGNMSFDLRFVETRSCIEFEFIILNR